MELQSDEPELLKNYLLGNVPAAVEERIETRLLKDREYGEAIAAAQNELLDDYAAGALNAVERAKFEEHFLNTPERVEKLQFARVLGQHAGAEARRGAATREKSPAPSRRRTFTLKFLVPVAAVLLLAFGIVLWKLRPDLIPHGRSTVSARNQKIEQEATRLNEWQHAGAAPPEVSTSVPVLTLEPLLFRESERSRRVAVGDGAEIVRLRLELLEDKYPTYRVTLQSPEGGEIFTLGGLRSRASDGGRLIIIDVPPGAVPPGSYLVRLSGAEAGGASAVDIGSYFFEAEGQK